MLNIIGSTPLPTEFGDWTYSVFFDDAERKYHTMMIHKRPEDIKSHPEDVLVRVHSSCATSELFHAVNCECREELEEAMKRIQDEGRGILIYLDQEGGGNGIEAKIKAINIAYAWNNNKIIASAKKDMNAYAAYKSMGYSKESRTFGIAVEMLKIAGVRSVRLLTNNPSKIKGLEESGIKTVAVGIHIKPKNEFVAKHLKAKAEELGHNISKEDLEN